MNRRCRDRRVVGVGVSAPAGAAVAASDLEVEDLADLGAECARRSRVGLGNDWTGLQLPNPRGDGLGLGELRLLGQARLQGLQPLQQLLLFLLDVLLRLSDRLFGLLLDILNLFLCFFDQAFRRRGQLVAAGLWRETQQAHKKPQDEESSCSHRTSPSRVDRRPGRSARHVWQEYQRSDVLPASIIPARSRANVTCSNLIGGASINSPGGRGPYSGAGLPRYGNCPARDRNPASSRRCARNRGTDPAPARGSP